MQKDNFISQITMRYKAVNDYLVSSKSHIMLLSGAAFFITATVLSYYALYHIRNPVTFYDIDGWGHLVRKMIESGKTWSLLPDAAYLWRGFVVPFIFGLSYCLISIPESVQILNVFLQTASAVILTYYFSVYYRKPLLGFGIGVIWAVWPPFSLLYGYYYSEPMCGFVSVLLWIISIEFLNRPTKLLSALLGIFLALSIHIRASGILVIILFFICFFTLWRAKARPFLPVIFISFLLVYLPWPVRNYMETGRFIPLTTGGGYVLHAGSYLPADDSLELLSADPEFQRRKAEGESMDLISSNKYFNKLAIDQIKADLPGQAKLTVKKFLRFWYYIPAHRWIPTPRTLLVMTPLLILAFIGSVRRFHDPGVQTAILMIVGVWVLCGILHAEFRYHVPVFPMLLFLAYQGGSYFFSTSFGSRDKPHDNIL